MNSPLFVKRALPTAWVTISALDPLLDVGCLSDAVVGPSRHYAIIGIET